MVSYLFILKIVVTITFSYFFHFFSKKQVPKVFQKNQKKYVQKKIIEKTFETKK
jgi:hypothetical protein